VTNSLRTGQHVQWNWGTGKGSGQIKERFERQVSRTIKGKKITRNGDKDNPAFLIEQADGDEVLKLGSEVEPGSSN
jgi:hypothetical protein